MFKGHKIKELLESNNLTKVSLYNYIGITKKSLDNIINGENIPNGNNIEAIADFFKLPIDFFFERKIEIDNKIQIGHNITGDGNNIGDIALSECQIEVNHLKQIIKEKETIIAEKERLINVLMK